MDFVIKGNGSTAKFFCYFTKGDKLHDFLFAALQDDALKRVSTLKGKNLLLEEQILSLKS